MIYLTGREFEAAVRMTTSRVVVALTKAGKVHFTDDRDARALASLIEPVIRQSLLDEYRRCRQQRAIDSIRRANDGAPYVHTPGDAQDEALRAVI